MNNQFIERAIKQTQWVKSGNLYIPPYLLKPKKRPSRQAFAVYPTYSEIFKRKISEREIFKALNKYMVGDAVSSASKLATTIENHGYFNKQIYIGTYIVI